MQKPPGVGRPACASAARFAAFGPTRSAAVASALLSERMKEDAIRSARCLFDVIAIARQRIDDGDLLDREIRHDLDAVLLDDQHLLDAHAVTDLPAVLLSERKGHAFFD